MLAAIILSISSVSLHLKNRPMGFFSNLSFSMSIKKKERVSEDKRMVHSKQNTQ